MDEYRYFNKFLESALINPKNIIVQEVDIFSDNVCIYVVTKNKNMFDVYTAVDSVDKSVNQDSINHVLIFEKQLNKLFEKVK